MQVKDTIVAIATPPGQGGVGIVRVSGPLAQSLSKSVIGLLPAPRYAKFTCFKDEHDDVIDEGIALYFPAPHSFTGEDVLELQGHGGPVVLDLLLKRLLSLGARIARPGEFSERAFLNNKIDLTQAEAIADLIECRTEEAAKLASRSLQGVFSQRIQDLLEGMIALRMYVEAAIDFPEEEIDFLSDGKVLADLNALILRLDKIEKTAKQGCLLRDGMILVIAGEPNAGKSSLLNALAGRESAIVTHVPGTTRDILREQIQIDGMPLHLIDTAGLRKSDDLVELEGIRRAKKEMVNADRILWMFDDNTASDIPSLNRHELPPDVPIVLVRNKIDLTGVTAGAVETDAGTEIRLSLKSGEGLDALRDYLKNSMGFSGQQEGEFIARRRHLDALKRASQHLHTGLQVLELSAAGELLAEDLRQAQGCLSEITGAFSNEDLLGKIFSSFCIGK